MFEWIRFIAEFIFGFISNIPVYLSMVIEANETFYAAFAGAPSFLQPILFAMLAVAVLMWVVNIF